MSRALIVAACLLAASAASAAVARVQGTLLNAKGRPLTGVARLDFRIVDARSKHELWSEPLEVEAVNGVFVAFLGLREPLPARADVRPTWRLLAEPPLGTRWLVGPLTEPEEDLRQAQLARLMVRLGLPAPERAVETPYEYRRLLSGAAPGLTPPETVSDAPACAEGASIDGTCPKETRRVLGREERLLRDRLERAAREDRPLPEPRVGLGISAR